MTLQRAQEILRAAFTAADGYDMEAYLYGSGDADAFTAYTADELIAEFGNFTAEVAQ